MTFLHRIRREAEADLDETYLWYERQREGLGSDFLLCFEEYVAIPNSIRCCIGQFAANGFGDFLMDYSIKWIRISSR